MSLSKQKQTISIAPFVFKLVGKYFQELYLHPIRTKSITSCVVLSLGNLTSQCLYGGKNVDRDSLTAFAAFGLLFGGTVPHLFYKLLESIAPGESFSESVTRFILERFVFTPLFQMLSLYSLAIFEGRSHQEACKQLYRSYMPVLKANWYYLSIFQFINIKFIPPMLRVLYGNLLGFFWCIYLARKRKQLAERRGGNRE